MYFFWPSGGIDMAGLGAGPAAGAGFQIEPHGLVQFGLKEIQKIVLGLGIHD